MVANTPNLKGNMLDAAGTSMSKVAKAVKVLQKLPEKRIPRPIKAVYNRTHSVIQQAKQNLDELESVLLGFSNRITFIFFTNSGYF